MGHVFLKVMFIGKEMLKVDEMPVDTGLPSQECPLM